MFFAVITTQTFEHLIIQMIANRMQVFTFSPQARHDNIFIQYGLFVEQVEQVFINFILPIAVTADKFPEIPLLGGAHGMYEFVQFLPISIHNPKCKIKVK